MELSNATPAQARFTVAPVPGYRDRVGMLVVKATWRVGPGGVPVLDGQKPHPMHAEDTPTPLGLLPRDDLPRIDPAFEVMLLGQAHAPGGRPISSMTVSLEVGSARRVLQVTGDRHWERGLFGAHITDPAPFVSLPLTWDRAFGGKAVVEIDRESFVDACDVRNPAGRGWDAAADAEALGKALKCPKGYPRFDPARQLPNLEDPAHLVRTLKDAPDPACWAPVPVTSSLHGLRVPVEPGKPVAGPGLFHRAHPCWVLPAPPPGGAVLALSGATPDGPWRFPLPRLRPELDLVAAGKQQTIAAVPQMLVLLPEESGFTITFRATVVLPPPDGTPRMARLRLEEGWSEPCR